MSIQKEIIEDFKVLDGDLEMTLNYLMELGEKLDTFKSTVINETILLTVLKTQQLVKELNDGSNNTYSAIVNYYCPYFQFRCVHSPKPQLSLVYLNSLSD